MTKEQFLNTEWGTGKRVWIKDGIYHDQKGIGFAEKKEMLVAVFLYKDTFPHVPIYFHYKSCEFC